MAPATDVGQLPNWQSWRNNTHPKWWKDKGLSRCMWNIILLYGTIFAYGYDGALISALQAQPTWVKQFNAPTGMHLGVISSSYLFPQIPVPFLASWMADRWGRRPNIWIGSITGLIGPIISACGNNEASFIAGRIVTGISASFYQVVAPALIAEIAHPRFRGPAAGCYYAVYYVGSFTVGWVSFGCVYWESDWAWRTAVMLQFLGCLPLLVTGLLKWQAESPRWLVKKKRHAEALRILAELHANGDETDELVVNEMAEIIEKVETDVKVGQGQFREFVSSKGNWRRLLCTIWFAWSLCMSGNNLIQYYLPTLLNNIGFDDPVKQQAMIAVNAVAGLSFSMAGGQLVDRVGRRKLLLFGLTMTIIMFASFTGLTGGFFSVGGNGIASAALLFLFLYTGFFALWAVALPFLYLPEILPYQLRVKGMAIYAIVTNTGALYNSLVNPIALEAIQWKYYLMFLGFLVGQLITAYFLVLETKGLTIEDIAVLFDGPKIGRGIEMGSVGSVTRSGSASSVMSDSVGDVTATREKQEKKGLISSHTVKSEKA